MYVTLRMRLLCKYLLKKIKNWCTKNLYIFDCTFKSIVNLKLKFWESNEKNMGFHLTSKFILLPVEPWG